MVRKELEPVKVYLLQYSAARDRRKCIMLMDIDEREMFSQEIKNCENTMRAVVSCIEALQDPMEKLILTLRYVNRYTWRKVIFAMQDKGYCESYTWQAHAHALQNLKCIIGKYSA